MSLERQIEDQLIEKLKSLKYEYREDIRDRDGLVKNFREKFQALNRVNLTDAEFDRLSGGNHHPGCLRRRQNPPRATMPSPAMTARR